MRNTFAWRFWEIFPGALVWTGLILPVIFSFVWPSAVAIYILIFDLFWLFRGFVMVYLILQTYRKMRIAMHTNFRSKLESLPRNDPIINNWRNIYQVVIFATFKEELDVLGPSVESVIKADWPTGRKIVLLAGEQRDRERLWRVGNYLKNKYQHKLFDFLISEHPDGIAGEVRGKGAGSSWAGRQLSKYVREKKIDPADVLVTIADADTRFLRQYFNAVAFEFVTNPNRHRRSYQPIPIYANNIWHVHTISRLTAWGSSFWQMVEASRPWRLINFSTHSYSLKMLEEMGYWSVDVVNEDSRQFWNAYFAFDGNHKVVPIYLPVHMDAVVADDLWTTLKNQYLQKRRWAYGIEHLPFIMINACRNRRISFWDKAVKIWRLIEGTYSWSTASFYLAFIGWLPLIFSETYRYTVLAQNYPIVARTLLSLAWIGAVISVYVSMRFLPPRPPQFKRTRYISLLLEWIVLPVSAFVWGSLPALEAQTRLMLGQYLTFWVTPKKGMAVKRT